MATLSTISNAATIADFLLEALPQAKAILRMYQGTDLQEPAEIAAFVLRTLNEHKQSFTVTEIDEVMRIYASIKKGIIDIKTKQASKAEKEKAFRRTFRKLIEFFKGSKTAAAIAKLMVEAAEGREQTMRHSDRALFREATRARNERAARDGGAGTLYSLESEFTASKISLLFKTDGPVPAWHPAAPTQSPQAAGTPAQPEPLSATQTPRTTAPSTQSAQGTTASTQTPHTTAVSQTPPATAASSQTTLSTAASTDPATGKNPFEDEQYCIALSLSSRNSTTSLSSLYTTCSTWASASMHAAEIDK